MTKYVWRVALAVAVATTPLTSLAAQEASPQPLRDSLRAALSFLASFDHGFPADYALDDRLIYTAPSYRNLDAAVADVVSPDIVIAKGQGRFGDALQFRKKNTQAVFYRAAVN